MPARLRWNVTPSTALCAASDLPDCPLIKAVDPTLFQGGLCRIHRLFNVYATTSPVPLPTPGLIIAPEIRLQSERYLPLAELRLLFNRLYREALTYPPILSSTPFHSALSWADCFGGLPSWLQFSANPARLLEKVVNDLQLLTRFLFFSFLPDRFNGHGFSRYPDQLAWLYDRLRVAVGPLRILDAACGSGEGTWELAELAAAAGAPPTDIRVEGWTVDPLEVWAARHRSLPHAPERQQLYRERVSRLVMRGWDRQVVFTVRDLREASADRERFDLIICNGLLGGPLLHQHEQMGQVVLNFSRLLAPGGILAVADRFHGGWKKQVPPQVLTQLLKACGLAVETAGEGLVARKAAGGTYP